MEAVPRVPMICFDLKVSSEPAAFGPKLKQFIRDVYHEDPDSYSSEILALENLRASAVLPLSDIASISTLKRYYCQLHFLRSRFPMSKDGPAAVSFTWKDTYTNMVYSMANIHFEMMCILYNIGALHSQLGAADSRNTADGMKLACTHFQCAAWAFQHLKEIYPQPSGVDSSPEMMQFMNYIMLAQAQECILEKSMMDNRKATIIAKVAVQIVDYYNLAMNTLTQGGADESVIAETVSSKIFKSWKRYVKFKISYHTCLSLLYQGQQAEEQQKMGERVAFYQAASEKLQEAVTLSKGMESAEAIGETLTFTMDVVEGKKKAAKNENEFIYHEQVPDKDTLPEMKGASLVKGIMFNVNDPEVSGPDIFARLVPMKAHEASSVYSEEKAKLLRKINNVIEERDKELDLYMTSLQLEHLNIFSEPERLPQELIERCAQLSAQPNTIQDLIDAMGKLADIYQDVEGMLQEIKELLEVEALREKEYQKVMGNRPPSIVATELTVEANKYQEAHSKASESNQTLHKAMTINIENLRLLSLPLLELEQQIPSIKSLRSVLDDPSMKELHHLISKVDEMRQQRIMLATTLRDNVCNDDITGQLVTHAGETYESVFHKEMQKHKKFVDLIEQNLYAQDNICKALTDAYARNAAIRRSIIEMIHKREATVNSLISSYDAYEDLLAKSHKGLEFYRKLERNVTKLLQRVKGTCKVQDEEREQILAKNKKSIPSMSLTKDMKSDVNPSTTSRTPKLKDYLDSMKRNAEVSGVNYPLTGESALYTSTSGAAGYSHIPPSVSPQLSSFHEYISENSGGTSDTVTGSQQWVPPVRPAPVGSEGTPEQNSYSSFNIKQSEAKLPFAYQNLPYSSVEPNVSKGPAEYFSSPYMYGSSQSSGYSGQSQSTYYGQIYSGQNYNSDALYMQQFPDKLFNYSAVQPQNPYNYSVPQAIASTTYSPQISRHSKSSDTNWHQQYVAGMPQQQKQYTTDMTQQFQQYATNVSQPQQYSTGMPQQFPQYTTSLQQQQYTGDTPQQPTDFSELHQQFPVDSSGQKQYPVDTTQQFNTITQQEQQIPFSSSSAQDQSNFSFSNPNVIYSTTTTKEQQPSNQAVNTNITYPTTTATQQQPLNQSLNTSIGHSYSSQNINTTGAYNMYNAQVYSSEVPKSLANESSQVPSHVDQQNTNYVAYHYGNYTATYSAGYGPPESRAECYRENEQLSWQQTQEKQLQPSANRPSSNSDTAPDSVFNYGSTDPQYLYSTTMYSQQSAITYSESEGASSSYQYIPSNNNSSYTSAGNNLTSHTNSSQMSVSGETFAAQYHASQNIDTYSTYTDNQYYSVPYGQQYESNTPNENTSQHNLSFNTNYQYNGANAQHQQSPMTYMQARTSNNSTNTTHSQQGDASIAKSSTKVEIGSESSSNVDLLAGLDFSVKQAPLLPQKSLTPKTESSTKLSSEISTTKSPPTAKTVADSPKSSTNASTTLSSEPDSSVSSEKVISSLMSSLTVTSKKEDNLILKIFGKDPYTDPDSLNVLKQEVEKFEKFVESLTTKTLNGPTPLDMKWKEILELQEKDAHKRSISVARCYPMKNRFSDILPYDHSRIELPSTKDDYINASHMKGITPVTPPFIVTQAPLPSTYTDFWTMVWEQQVEVIVCLLSDMELEGHSYWPVQKGQELEIGKMRLVLQSSNNHSHWIERLISVSVAENRISRVIVHLQFTAWPGSSFPASPGPFLGFVSEVLNFYRQQRGSSHPLVVHCLSGVGRTGLFCLIVAAVCEIQASRGILDLVTTTATMSTHRKNSLRDREHLKFAYQSVLYYAQDLLMKRGILTSCPTFEEKRSREGKCHTRHPSEDFLLGPPAGLSQLQSGLEKMGLDLTNKLSSSKSTQDVDNEDGLSSVDSNIITDCSSATQSPLPTRFSGLLDPSQFNLKLEPAIKKQDKRVSRESFEAMQKSSKLSIESLDTSSDDPLSSLDPMWSLKKD